MKRTHERFSEETDPLMYKLCSTCLDTLRDSLVLDVSISIVCEEEQIKLMELAFESCDETSQIDLTKRVLNIISCSSNTNDKGRVWYMLLRLLEFFCLDDSSRLRSSKTITLLESHRTNVVNRLLDVFRNNSYSKSCIMSGQALSLFPPNQSVIPKTNRLVFFMSYLRRISWSHSSVNFDISDCVDAINAILTEHKDLKPGSDIEELSKHFLSQEYENESEQIETLEQFVLGT